MKVLFTDLDGTLLNNDGKVSDITRDYIVDFLEKGNILALSSGRPLRSILEVKDNARIPDNGTFVIAFNGCLIYDCACKSIIYETPVPLGMVDILQGEAKKQNIHIQTYSDEGIICESMDEEIEYYTQRVHLPIVLSNRYTDVLKKEPYKMLSIDLVNFEQHEKFAQYINEKYGDKITTIFSNKLYLEYFNADGGKGNAIFQLCDYLGVSINDTIAAGDADNDISMIEVAGTGVAMKNASQKIKMRADEVTKYTNDEDGLARCLREIVVFDR